MTKKTAAQGEPLWLSMERKILDLAPQDLTEGKREQTIQRIAGELDKAGHNVSRAGGNMLQLRSALDARLAVGRPLLSDFDAAIAALTLDDVADPSTATAKLIGKIGETWPKLLGSERKSDVRRIVEKARLDLLIAGARELSGEAGVRFLIAEDMTAEVITEALGISLEEYGRVNAAVAAERAQRTRVAELLGAVADKSIEERLKHLIDNDVSDELIIEMAGVEPATLDAVKQAMEAELEEKRRLAEEAAARKKAEAEGPALEEIPADQLLQYIEGIREILEFSEVESEIRSMCEQSSIPKCLADIAVSAPDRLDELEQKAEG